MNSIINVQQLAPLFGSQHQKNIRSMLPHNFQKKRVNVALWERVRLVNIKGYQARCGMKMLFHLISLLMNDTIDYSSKGLLEENCEKNPC